MFGPAQTPGARVSDALRGDNSLMQIKGARPGFDINDHD
jgi:hypothetical protein